MGFCNLHKHLPVLSRQSDTYAMSFRVKAEMKFDEAHPFSLNNFIARRDLQEPHFSIRVLEASLQENLHDILRQIPLGFDRNVEMTYSEPGFQHWLTESRLEQNIKT